MKEHRKTDKERLRDQADNIIAGKFKSSSMSNAKWIRLFDALTENEGLVTQCDVKLVWDDEIREIQIDGMQFEFDYWKHAMEGMITGTPRGWFEYKEIEWIEFGAENNSIEKIDLTIRKLGHFDLEDSNGSLRLYAYRE